MEPIHHSGTVLRQARKLSGLSQREVAHRAGTAQSVVARIEGGQTSPSIETLSRLLNACGFEYHLAIAPQRANDPVVERYKRDIDRSLLRENVTRSFEDRLDMLAALAAFATEARRAGKLAGN